MITVTVMKRQLSALPRRQIYRYMGMRNVAADAELQGIVEELLPKFLGKVQCRACCTVVPVTISGSRVDLTLLQTDSTHLARNLQGCSKAVLFAATLGMGVEQQKRTAAVQSPLRALVLDAMGSAAIEQFCNELCGELAAQHPAYKARPRFSPGYGDLTLEVQKDLLQVLNTPKTIGVTLTEGMLMLPQKSVTAVMGLGQCGCMRPVPDCADCGVADCKFRL